MTDNVEQFHAKFSDDSDDLVPWQEPGDAVQNGESAQRNGRGAQNGRAQDGGGWEEPQWDEPRAAEPWEGRTADWLTPVQLRSVVFRRAAFGKRGLDEQQVNGFLDRVEQELTLLLQEKRALEAEVTRLREYVAGTQPSQPAVQPTTVEQPPTAGQLAVPQPTNPEKAGKALATPEDNHVPVQQAVSRVQEAHVYAASILSQAQQTADQYMQEAQQYSRELVEDARRRRADLLTRQAHPQDQEAAQLRAANQHYRGNLRDYLQVLLNNLDEWEAAEVTGPSAPPSEEPGQP